MSALLPKADMLRVCLRCPLCANNRHSNERSSSLERHLEVCQGASSLGTYQFQQVT
jgi:hypothetical protein